MAERSGSVTGFGPCPWNEGNRGVFLLAAIPAKSSHAIDGRRSELAPENRFGCPRATSLPVSLRSTARLSQEPAMISKSNKLQITSTFGNL
jgi:hypothetical protein